MDVLVYHPTHVPLAMETVNTPASTWEIEPSAVVTWATGWRKTDTAVKILMSVLVQPMCAPKTASTLLGPIAADVNPTTDCRKMAARVNC